MHIFPYACALRGGSHAPAWPGAASRPRTRQCSGARAWSCGSCGRAARTTGLTRSVGLTGSAGTPMQRPAAPARRAQPRTRSCPPAACRRRARGSRLWACPRAPGAPASGRPPAARAASGSRPGGAQARSFCRDRTASKRGCLAIGLALCAGWPPCSGASVDDPGAHVPDGRRTAAERGAPQEHGAGARLRHGQLDEVAVAVRPHRHLQLDGVCGHAREGPPARRVRFHHFRFLGPPAPPRTLCAPNTCASCAQVQALTFGRSRLMSCSQAHADGSTGRT